jgi:hypothetical protein
LHPPFAYFPLSLLATSHILALLTHLTALPALQPVLPAAATATLANLAPLTRPLLALGLGLAVPAVLSGAAAFWSLVRRQALPGDSAMTVRWTPKVRFAATHAAAMDVAVAISAWAWVSGQGGNGGDVGGSVLIALAAAAALWVGGGAGYLLVYGMGIPGSGIRNVNTEKKES